MTIDMEIVMERGEHLGDDQLESYSIGNLGDQDAARLEEHVLICETCQDKLAESDSWVRSVKRAALNWTTSPKRVWVGWSLPRLIPILATVVVILAATVALRFNRQGVMAPVAVALEATRGPAIAPRVPALRPLMLEPGLEGLRPLDRYHLEIVDRFGKEIWRADWAPVSGAVSGVLMPGLSPGLYFVRLYDTSRTLLREFAVEAGEGH